MALSPERRQSQRSHAHNPGLSCNVRARPNLQFRGSSGQSENSVSVRVCLSLDEFKNSIEIKKFFLPVPGDCRVWVVISDIRHHGFRSTTFCARAAIDTRLILTVCVWLGLLITAHTSMKLASQSAINVSSSAVLASPFNTTSRRRFCSIQPMRLIVWPTSSAFL